MANAKFPPRTRVRNRATKAEGTVVPDYPLFGGADIEDDVTVIYDGTAIYVEVGQDFLEIIGAEEPRPDPYRCGAGKGAACCVFLTCGAGGFNCERHTGLRWVLISRAMNAKRKPVAPYPDCMDQAP